MSPNYFLYPWVFLKKQILLMLLLFSSPLFAQQSLIYHDPLQTYKEALSLFEQKIFVTAKQKFLEVAEAEAELIGNENQTIQQNARAYAAFCAAELVQPDAEKLLKDIINIYDEPPLKRLAYYYLGVYYFRERNFSAAAEWLEKTDTDDLPNAELAEYKFMLAYSYFYRKKLKEAAPLFKEVRNIKNKYYYPANYYYGYIAFENKNFDEALESFNRIKESQAYQKIIPYYIAQIHYYKKEYDELIAYLTPLINDSGLKYYAELNQILGQAYFEQKKYDKAIRHLTIFITQSGKARKEDIYQLGYAHYKNNDCDEAVIQFEQLDHFKDTVGQNALYLLGDCYLKNNQKSRAHSAFQQASQMDFDPHIRENALFNFAKLSYELGFSTEAIRSFQEYIDKYKNSENSEEAKELLTELFLNTRNFAEAIRVIESIKNPSAKVKRAYQEIAFSRAVELYNDKEYDEAIKFFDASLKNPDNATIKALCYYWKGESYFAQEEFSKALREYNEFLDLANVEQIQDEQFYTATAQYGAGYALLKQKKYGDALPRFTQAVTNARNAKDQQLKEKVLPDALLRGGDCAFITKDYSSALKNYSEIISDKRSGSDYALYQKGVILGLQGKLEEKISTLEQIERQHPRSLYLDDALYEIGTANIALDKSQSAIQAFRKVIEKFPASPFVTKAYLKMALTYYNQNDVQNAVDSYKRVIALYPQSQDAQQALLGLKDISIAEGNPKIYMDVANKSGLQVSASAKDSISYLSAETQFASGKCNEAILSFTEYLDDFKNGFFKLPAHFYRGECFYTNKNFEKALEDYQYVIDAGRNLYTEKALAKASRITYENKNYEQAHTYFKLLIENASFKENIYAANLGLMRTSFQLGRMQELKEYANAVLNSADSPQEHDIEAEYYLAKAAFAEKNYAEASRLFKKVADATTTVLGSEAKYRVAEISFLQGDFKKSMDETFAFIEEKPTHEYWRVKGFLLLSDNYVKAGNIFQAKATLQSIIDNYKGEELLKEAREKLNKILAEEKANQKIQIISDTSETFESDPNDVIELVVPEENDTIK